MCIKYVCFCSKSWETHRLCLLWNVGCFVSIYAPTFFPLALSLDSRSKTSESVGTYQMDDLSNTVVRSSQWKTSLKHSNKHFILVFRILYCAATNPCRKQRVIILLCNDLQSKKCILNISIVLSWSQFNKLRNQKIDERGMEYPTNTWYLPSCEWSLKGSLCRVFNFLISSRVKSIAKKPVILRSSTILMQIQRAYNAQISNPLP